MSSAFRESLKILVPLVIVWFASLILPSPWAWIASGPLFLLILFTLYFFRDPERLPEVEARDILSAADGTVVAIDTVDQAPLDQGKMKRVSIFLSVFDVHVNRTPVSGTVTKIQYTPGGFHDARLPEASLHNERQDWLIDSSQGPVVVRQIAGLIARRIVAWAQEKQSLERGERIGMIRFGSRTEIYLPEICEVTVKPGQKVQGGLTVIARWPEFKV